MIQSLFLRILSTIQYEQFVAGLFGGILSSIILHPFDLIKIRFQVTENRSSKNDREKLPYRPYYKNFYDAFQSIYKEKGLKGLYEGVTPNVVGNGISWGLYLFLYNTIVVLLNSENKQDLTFKSRFIYSTIAGLLATIITNPIWVIKTRMCLQYSKSKSVATYNNMFDAFKKIYQLEGIKAFYKGLTPGLFGIFHGTIQFSSYEQMKHIYMHLFNLTYCPTLVIIIISSLSKFIAVIITYPSQVVRTRLQDQHQHYENAIDVIRKTYEQDGLRGFFKGLMLALYRVIPASCITFVVYESVLRILR